MNARKCGLVNETGPDQNKLQIRRPDSYCDNEAYIYCVYCACSTISSFNTIFLFEKKKKPLFSSIIWSPIVNSTWEQTTSLFFFYVVAKLIRTVLIMAAFQIFILYNIVNVLTFQKNQYTKSDKNPKMTISWIIPVVKSRKRVQIVMVVSWPFPTNV